MVKKEGVNVVIVEDDRDYCALLRAMLKYGGHRVVEELTWVATAMNAVNEFGKQRVNVITLDQDLFGGDVVRAGFIKAVRKQVPDVKIIGMSGCEIMGGEVDTDLTKTGLCILNSTIARLISKSKQ